MKKIIYILLFSILLIPNIIFASTKEINMYLFYGEECPHCKQLKEFLNEYLEDKPNITLHQFEIWHNEENIDKLYGVMDILKDPNGGLPYLVIGNNAIVGYADEITNNKIKNTVNYYENIEYKDEVGIYLELVEEQEEVLPEVKYEETIDEISAPKRLKSIVKNSPLIFSAMIIGLVDGFNPCAMWILLLLISLLLTIKESKRRWILGIAFLLATAGVYFVFLLSWVNFSVFLNGIEYINLAIASLAIILGILSLAKFVKSLFKDTGCEVVDKKKRKKLITSIQKIVKEKSFFLAVIGIMILAVAVNIIELFCSLGLPAMFAQVLALNDTTSTMRIIYCLVYVLFFILDDALVFFISMKSLEIKAISNRFSKYSSLIGGLLMIAIGFLMLYKPEWLMLSF